MLKITSFSYESGTLKVVFDYGAEISRYSLTPSEYSRFYRQHLEASTFDNNGRRNPVPSSVLRGLKTVASVD